VLCSARGPTAYEQFWGTTALLRVSADQWQVLARRVHYDAEFEIPATVLTFQHLGMPNVRAINFLGEPPTTTPRFTCSLKFWRVSRVPQPPRTIWPAFLRSSGELADGRGP
jgi:hypothetical protein